MVLPRRKFRRRRLLWSSLADHLSDTFSFLSFFFFPSFFFCQKLEMDKRSFPSLYWFLYDAMTRPSFSCFLIPILLTRIGRTTKTLSWFLIEKSLSHGSWGVFFFCTIRMEKVWRFGLGGTTLTPGFDRLPIHGEMYNNSITTRITKCVMLLQRFEIVIGYVAD